MPQTTKPLQTIHLLGQIQCQTRNGSNQIVSDYVLAQVMWQSLVQQTKQNTSSFVSGVKTGQHIAWGELLQLIVVIE